MKWNKLIILSSVALGMFAISTARAQGHMHGGAPGMGGHVAPGMAGGGFHGHDFGGHHFHHHFNDFVFFDFGFPFYGYPFYYPYSFYYPYPYYGYDPYYGYYGAPGYQGYGGYQRYGGGSSVVIEVQRRLAAGGYYHGAIDGVIGSGTRRAIRNYERSRGLPVDGVLTRRFLARLGLA